jgi:hypothetical protein
MYRFNIASVIAVCIIGLILAGCGGKGTGDSSCTPCTPDCTAKSCGNDGCGGNCGVCNSPMICVEPINKCIIMEKPSCVNRRCGPAPDFPTHNCGSCPDAWHCSLDKMHCETDTGDCSEIPAGGICLDGYIFSCVAGIPKEQYCTQHYCNIDSVTQKAQCTDMPCLPDCFGRTCGSDGCNGSCGECGDGTSCESTLGICLPVGSGCGTINKAICEGHVVVNCQDGQVSTEECTAQGKVCADPCGDGATCWSLLPETPCGRVPASNTCRNGYLFSCLNGALQVIPCLLDGYQGCTRIGVETFDCYL